MAKTSGAKKAKAAKDSTTKRSADKGSAAKGSAAKGSGPAGSGARALKAKKPKTGRPTKAKRSAASRRGGRVVAAVATASELVPAELVPASEAPASVAPSEPDVDISRRSEPERPLTQVLRVERGFRLADVDPDGSPGFDGDREDGERALTDYTPELGEWQERLYAETKGGGRRSVLLVIQGMDTSGKGGIMRHVVGACDPHGIAATSFKAPTAEERQHDFLWRIEKALPRPGQLGVFDRSHYEDVLIVRVHELVPRAEWSRRYAQINAFERTVIASGTRIVKVMLHVSKDEQKRRLAERLERPDKHYKYNPGDVDERAYWDDYMAAYQAVLDKTSTRGAPWYVVPADKKWYARYAVQQLLLEAFRDLAPQWPVMDFDVAAEQERLAAS